MAPPVDTQTHPGDANQSPSAAPFAPIPHELQDNLHQIVGDIVNNLGYVGAMVATLEPDNSLPVRAYAVDTSPAILDVVKWLETTYNIGFISPKSVTYIDDKKYANNLSVRAINGSNGHPEIIVSDRLHDLITPVLPKWVCDRAQKLTNVKQVIAVPFFMENEDDGESEVVGNLFAGSREEFSARDISFLTAFGRQAAAAIQNQRRLAEVEALERVILDLQASIDNEKQVLQIIVDAVVEKLGYIGAMVATLESDGSLPVRTYALNTSPQVSKFLDMLEAKFNIGFVSPKSVAYLNNEKFADNLSVRAIKGTNGHPEIIESDSLYDLCRPVLNEFLSNQGQKIAGVKRVIAVPFFIKDQVVGNLFVASSRNRFSGREKRILKAFGQQAAVGIRNARLYQKSEERREAAQIFAKMAFTAAAYVHNLRNHIGAFRMFSQMTRSQLDEKFQKLNDDVMERLDEAANILETLHEPWREQPHALADVNLCLNRALTKAIPDPETLKNEYNINLHTSLDEAQPVNTSPDMLTEAFRVLAKNAVEALREKCKPGGIEGNLWVRSRQDGQGTVEISIQDTGIGIKPEHLGKIFEMRWSTKNVGMGFGLFWTRDYIEGQGGQIELDSIWGEGTEFRIKLPTVAS